MLRTIRLTASVLVLTSGIWLALVFLMSHVDSHPEAVPSAIPVGSSAGLGPGRPVIRQLEQVDLDPPGGAAVAAESAASASLAEVAPLVTAVERPMEAFHALPPAPAVFHQSPPSLSGVYRSALDLPPPPLLDAHAPPPLAGTSTWRKPSSREATLVAWRGNLDEAAGGLSAGLLNTSPDVPGENAYAVRDGDDLTAIAVRFYGNPAAAELLWQANQDRLSTPDLLPIGTLLRLPPPSHFLQGRPDRPGGWIEPATPP